MREQLDDYLVEQEILKHDPYYAIKFLWSDAKEPPKPPSQSVSTIETTLDAEGKLGLSLPLDSDPNADSGIPNLTLSDFGLKFGTTGKWTQIHDNETGNTTYTTGGEVFGRGQPATSARWVVSSRASSAPASRSPGTRTTTSSSVATGDHPRGQGDQLGQRRSGRPGRPGHPTPTRRARSPSPPPTSRMSPLPSSATW